MRSSRATRAKPTIGVWPLVEHGLIDSAVDVSRHPGFDRKRGNGIVYFTAGRGSDMSRSAGEHSAFYCWEEKLLTAAAEFSQFDYSVQ